MQEISKKPPPLPDDIPDTDVTYKEIFFESDEP